MPYELRIYKLIRGLEKQRATHLANMEAHKKQAKFSTESAEACLVTICALDIEILDVKSLLKDEESK